MFFLMSFIYLSFHYMTHTTSSMEDLIMFLRFLTNLYPVGRRQATPVFHYTRRKWSESSPQLPPRELS